MVIIDILLTTYNGENYLESQIDSIIRQSFSSWKLFIRDDGSTDNTKIIISKYCKLYPEKIFEIIDNYGNVGSSLSFSLLLEQSRSDYIMFCDQDDVWIDNKIQLTYNEIIKNSKDELPVMVFTDMVVVDEKLNLIYDSFMKNQKLYPEVLNKVHKAIALNVVAGCTIMINKWSKNYILPFPKFLTHDYWIGINLSYYGSCIFLDEKTLLYRQHGKNVYGALGINYKYFVLKIIKITKYFETMFKLKNSLQFEISILAILYYKVLITFKRLK